MGSLLRELTGEYEAYLRDESHTVGRADWIAFPRTEEEVARVLREAWERDIPVTLQGGRTGISAGCVPHGGAVVSLSRMTRAEGCRALDDGRFSFLLQPGVVLSELGKWVESKRFDTRGWDGESLAAYGGFCRAGEFFFSPDPTERSACIGGMAACNASGARSYCYGPVRDHILSLRAVLMDGRTVALRRGERFARGLDFELPCEDGSVLRGRLPGYAMPATKNTSGYYCAPDMDLMDLFIGSDGTLAALTQVEAALLPLPAFQWCVNAYFMEEGQAIAFVKAVRDSVPKAAAIEYFDGDALDILRRQRAENPAFAALPPVPDGAAAAVCVELHDDDRASIQARLFRLGEQLTAAGGREEDTQVARTAADVAALKFFRHAVPESVNMLIAQRKKLDPVITKLGTDMAVPDDRLEEVVALYRRGLAETGLQSAVWGHAGNNHLHVNILPRNGDDYRRGKALYADWARAVTGMGGAVSSEHAVGKAKADFLEIMYGPEHIAGMRALKRVFDPKGLLGQDNLFAKEGI